MSQIVSLRLPDETAARLKASARRAGRSVNELGAISIEEWLRQTEFAEIEFRSFGGERHACLKGALPVWQLIMVAKGYRMNAARTAQHFRWPVNRVRAGFHYYAAHKEEIDRVIADNHSVTRQTLERLLPQLEVFQARPRRGGKR
jgi:hypothetical protein